MTNALDQAIEESKRAQIVLHEEDCYYARPCEMLAAIFGEENCLYSQCEGIDILRLEPSKLTYSMRSQPNGRDWRVRLAQTTLRSLPPWQIGEMKYRRLVKQDPSMCENPFATRLRRPPPPPTFRNSKAPIDLFPQPVVVPADINAMKVALAEQCNCKVEDIRTVIANTRRDNRNYKMCTIFAGTHLFVPQVFAATAFTAEREALMHALCRL